MKFLTALFVGAVALATTSAVAQQRVDEKMEVPKGTEVFVDNERGSIEVMASDDNLVHVTGTLDKRTERFIFELRGTTLHVQVKTPEQNGWFDDEEGSKLTLYMPKTSHLDIKGVSMDVEAFDLQAGVETDLVSGDVKLENIDGGIEVSTVSGDISTRAVAGSVRLESVSGDISDKSSKATVAHYQAVSGDIDVQAEVLEEFYLQNVSGDVSAELPKLKKGNLKNVSGDIHISLNLADNGELKASSVSGDMAFIFASMPNASFDISTNAGGDITNQLSNDKATESRWGTSSELNFEVGSGSARVGLTTVSGTVEIRRD
ncbi:putative adhesin [Idiomarina fontislapidosi]|uniref:DUF4097 domain-containing protein n=1 Tax=Idiomarina fontislapidosi TaxID=263723 RepID=A0A432XUX9_9GAMM|nr:DUF4097 family beta strand repeat-containing protein [Idiomarina fontislapidosi]PYE31788.1 putative adhesin [Idiomarina fontislapidosi]RUO52536.1 hypothetical protein CWE25_09415 [Idiomarina fontislapidosi]